MMSHEMYTSSRMEQRPRRLAWSVLLLAVVASQVLLLLPRLLPASFVAAPKRIAKSVTRRRAEPAGIPPGRLREALQAQLSGLLENDAIAKRSWATFCDKMGLKTSTALRNQPAEAMQSFLAEPGSYKQPVLLEFLKLNSVNKPLIGLDRIDREEHDPIIKSGLVRELTVKQLETLIDADPEMEKLWFEFRTEKLAQLQPTEEEQREARQLMAMTASFARPKRIVPGTMEALAAQRRYEEGINIVPDFDMDSGEDDVRR
mmetsp:Transcript_91111/g.237524  ORF Transcript_91111/g.237524 Transcript_91111/m.237524 type:complete len:259 (-) Transcript_91111:150-926(-)